MADFSSTLLFETARAQYEQRFVAFQKKHKDQEPVWLSNQRTQAMRSFASLGFPTRRLESWKYTDVKPILETTFEFLEISSQDELDEERLAPLRFGQKGWHELIFSNASF